MAKMAKWTTRMTRAIFFRVFFILVLLAAASGPVAFSQAPSASMTILLPPGPLLVLESNDLSALVEGWDNSPEKLRWLQGDNYSVFKRSRLFLRMQTAQEEFATAAGFHPEMKFLSSIAGTDSRLALYDIGNLEFLFVTKLASARVAETLLWQTQARFEPRQIDVDGDKYFIHTDEKSKRVVAFAAPQGYLMLATREDLLVEALRNLHRQDGQTIQNDAWYRAAMEAAGPMGDLRLVMDLESVLATPHFRSYWIQGNQSELLKYKAGISDLYFSAQGVREERVLLTALDDSNSEKAGMTTDAEQAVNDLLRVVPPDAGLYRAWAVPSSEEALSLIIQKLLGRYNNPARWARTISSRGSTQPLELRIDQAPAVVRTGGFAPQSLKKELEETGLRGMLHIQSSRYVAGEVFVTNDSVIVMSGESAWNANSVCRHLVEAVETLWTTSSLGLTCESARLRGRRFVRVDALASLNLAVQDKYLLIATSPEALLLVMARLDAEPPEESGEYVAGFRHGRERDYFERMMTLLDHPWAGRFSRGRRRARKTPQFFSDNIESLSDSLQRVSSVTFRQRTRGSKVFQTVEYRMEQ